MLSGKQLEAICKDLPPYYQRVGLRDLMKVAKKAAFDAEQNYKELPEPKTRSLFSYVSFYTKAAVIFNTYNSNLGLTLKKLEQKNEHYKQALDKYTQAHAEY